MQKSFQFTKQTLILCILSIFTLCFLCGFGAVSAETTVTDEQSFRDAMTARETSIILANDITLTSGYSISWDLTISSPTQATLLWGGAANGTMFTVSGTGHLALTNTVLDGGGIFMSMVRVNGATLTMNDGAVLKNLQSNGGNHAVIVGSPTDPTVGGTFNMNGGLITGVSLDAAVICYNATINMHGSASISENDAYGIGIISSTLNMTGSAAISNNTSTSTGAAVLAGYQSVINMGLNEGDAPRMSGNTASQYYGGAAYLVDSELNMRFDATISDNTAHTFGGGVALNKSTLTMRENASIRGNIAPDRGGGIIISESTVDMTDAASVTGNAVTADDGRGGGIFLQNAPSQLTMQDSASVYGNQAAFGAGIYQDADTIVQMLDGTIRDNIAQSDGGGIYCDGSLGIYGGAVTGNQAESGNGGGVYLTFAAGSNISGAYVTINSALNGSGGGIYTEDTGTYSNVYTDVETVFSGNAASVAYTPPENPIEEYPHILFASPSISYHPLNNYDINYSGTDVLFFHVIYESNGGTGHYVGPDTAPYHAATILSVRETGITHRGYEFIGWNTKPDGSGDAHAPGEAVPLTQNMTVYAQWAEEDHSGRLCLFLSVLLLFVVGFCVIRCICCKNR